MARVRTLGRRTPPNLVSGFAATIFFRGAMIVHSVRAATISAISKRFSFSATAATRAADRSTA